MPVISRTSSREREQLRRAAAASDQGPTDEQQSGGEWPLSDFLRMIKDPHDPTNVSFPFLRRIRRDHMVAMCYHLIEMGVLKSPFFYEGPDARACAFADNLIRPIYGRLVRTIIRMVWAGYSPAVKRFKFVQPDWVYYQHGEAKKVWTSSAQAAIYRPVLPLKPELCRPAWKGGDFDGIKYDPRYSVMSDGRFIVDGFESKKIDLQHSIWATHGREGEDDSIYGFSRLAHCAPIFWEFWRMWDMMGRAFENNADPGPVMRYPQESPPLEGEDGQKVSAVQTALTIGRRRRSGSTVALPSDPYTTFDDRPSTAMKWGMEFPKHDTDFEAMMNWMGYLEAAKCQCVPSDTPVDCPRDYAVHPDGVPISELKKGQLIWCFNESTSEFELRPVKIAAPTRKNADLLELTLDTGKKIKATPDHKFMRRDGSWAELGQLRAGDSLMPLDRDFEPFVKTKPNARGWGRGINRDGRECDLVARASLGEKEAGVHLHHTDDRHLNTSPENLEYLSNAEHTTVTNKGMRRPPGFHSKMREGLPERNCLDCEALFKPRGPTSVRCEQCQRSARFQNRYKASTINTSKRLKELKTCEDCGRDYAPNSNRQKWCNDCRLKNWPDLVSKSREVSQEDWIGSLTNHKVVSIEPCDREDTWDLSVDGPAECHSFVVHGVVLHNSIWMPEQGVTGQSITGSSSNRNVFDGAGDLRDESLGALLSAIDELIDNVLVRPAFAMNMPEFEGTVQKRTLGINKDAKDAIAQVTQLIGQENWRNFGIDAQKIAEARGFPMLDPAGREKQLQDATSQAEAQPTPVVTPTQGRRAMVTQTGFNETAYVQLDGYGEKGTIAVDGDFVAGLPSSGHFSDKAITALARRLRGAALSLYVGLYQDFAIYASHRRSSAGDDDRWVSALMDSWVPRAERSKVFEERARSVLASVIDRRADLTLHDLHSSKRIDSDSSTRTMTWLRSSCERASREAETQTKRDLRSFLESEVADPLDASRRVREGFVDWASRRADQLAQDEVVRAHNFATLMAGEFAGVKMAQLIDDHEEECEHRDGRIMSVSDALEQDLGGPGCQLSIKLVPLTLDIARHSLDGGVLARYDEDTQTVILSPDLDEDGERQYMKVLVGSLSAPSSNGDIPQEIAIDT